MTRDSKRYSPPYEGGVARRPRSPPGRSLKRRRAGVVAYTETWRVSDHPRLGLRPSLPSFARRGILICRSFCLQLTF